MQGITPKSGFEKRELHHQNAPLIIHAQGASILSMGISMVQVAFLESRFRGDSLHSGAWSLRLAAQAAAIRACRITAQAGHNLALHELKQIRCTGRADSSLAYLDLRPPPETFDTNRQK